MMAGERSGRAAIATLAIAAFALAAFALAAFALAAFALVASAPAHAVSPPQRETAPPPAANARAETTYVIGPFEPAFEPPAPGTYELPPIDTITDHPLVDSSGRATTLEAIVGDRTAVVSFIYGTCTEAMGCPFSNAVLQKIDHRLRGDAQLAANVALVTISFDPEHDTPERLAVLQKMRAPGSTWTFATAPDAASLDRLLGDFGQTVTRLRNADGTPGATFRHVLKVFLVDRARRVRNIYSVGLFSPDLVWNDIVTLSSENGARKSAATRASDDAAHD